MKPYAVTWNITNRCNLQCSHCALDFNNRPMKELSYEECKEIIDDLSNEKVFMISFSGGEPLVRRDFSKIIEYCYSKKITTVLATNGLLLTESLIRDFIKHGMTAIALSLDSINQSENDAIRGAGTYNKILKAMKLVTDSGMNLLLSITVDKDSLHNLKDMLQFAYDKKCKRVKTQIVLHENEKKYELALNPEQIKEVGKVCSEFCDEIDNQEFIAFNCYSNYLRKFFKYGINSKICNAGEKRASIMPNGDLYLCELLPYTMKGNLKLERLNDIWDNTTIIKDLQTYGKCSECYNSKICNGGCPIFSTTDGGLNDRNCI